MPKSLENLILTIIVIHYAITDCSGTPSFKLQTTLLAILQRLKGDPYTI